MDYRYGELPLDLLQALLSYEELLRLFLDLVTRAGGDVEEALRWLKELQRRGLISPDIDLEAFRAELEKQGLIGKDGQGNLVLSGHGRAPPPPLGARGDLLVAREGGAGAPLDAGLGDGDRDARRRRARGSSATSCRGWTA